MSDNPWRDVFAHVARLPPRLLLRKIVKAQLARCEGAPTHSDAEIEALFRELNERSKE